MARFIIQADNAQTIAALNRVVAATQRPEPLFREMGEYLQFSHRRRFDREVDPDGRPWTPNAPSTIRTYARKRGGRKKVLHGLTLLLRDTLTYNVLPRGLEFGSPAPYSNIHQFGGRAGRGGRVVIPERPFIGLSREDQAELERLAANFLERQLRR